MVSPLARSATAPPPHAFPGHQQPDGQVGIRNRLLVLFTVVCAEEVSRRIASQLEDAIIVGWRDCTLNPGAQRKMLRLAANPSVGAVLVMSLGCECSDAPAIADNAAAMLTCTRM